MFEVDSIFLGYIYNNVYAYVCAFLLYSLLPRMVIFFFNTDLTDWTDFTDLRGVVTVLL